MKLFYHATNINIHIRDEDTSSSLPMIIVRAFKLTGRIICYFSPKKLLAVLLFALVSPILLTVNHVAWYGSVVVIGALYWYLTLDEIPLPSTEYGSYKKNNPSPLSS